MKAFLKELRVLAILLPLLLFVVTGQLAMARINNDISTGGGTGAAYPFTLTGNATSTLTQFNGGLTAYASSTIGNGTQGAGITVNGGATTTGSTLMGSSTLFPNSVLTVKTSHAAGAGGIVWGLGDANPASSSAMLYSYKPGTGAAGALTIIGLNYYLDGSGTGQKNDPSRNGWGITTDTRTTNTGSLIIQHIDLSATVTNPFAITPTGNVGIGTTTPATRLQISSGASATTTATIGELGLTSSKACVNMNRADGGAGSFYLNSAGTPVGEANYCK